MKREEEKAWEKVEEAREKARRARAKGNQKEAEEWEEAAKEWEIEAGEEARWEEFLDEIRAEGAAEAEAQSEEILQTVRRIEARQKGEAKAKASDADLVKTFWEFDEALRKDPAKKIEEVAEGVLAEAATYKRSLGKMGSWQLKKAYDGWMELGKPNAAQYAEIHKKLGRRPNKADARRYVEGARKPT